MGTEPAKRLHRTPDHPRKQAPPLQSRCLGVRTPLPAARGSGSVRQSRNSIQILVVATRVEVRAGVRKVKSRECLIYMACLIYKTGPGQIFPLQPDIHGLRDECQRPGLRGRTSTTLGRALMLADGVMDARGRVYEGGPQPLWASH